MLTNHCRRLAKLSLCSECRDTIPLKLQAYYSGLPVPYLVAHTHKNNKSKVVGQHRPRKRFWRPCAGELFRHCPTIVTRQGTHTHLPALRPFYRPSIHDIISSLPEIRGPTVRASLLRCTLCTPSLPTIPFTLVQPFNYFILFGLLRPE